MPIRLTIILRLVTEANNMALNCHTFIHCVQETIFNIDADNLVGPNGLSSLFFQHCWDIV